MSAGVRWDAAVTGAYYAKQSSPLWRGERSGNGTPSTRQVSSGGEGGLVAVRSFEIGLGDIFSIGLNGGGLIRVHQFFEESV
ncbi:hypothetical protein HNY73_015652, partial [Argiope bruennichi]